MAGLPAGILSASTASADTPLFEIDHTGGRYIMIFDAPEDAESDVLVADWDAYRGYVKHWACPHRGQFECRSTDVVWGRGVRRELENPVKYCYCHSDATSLQKVECTEEVDEDGNLISFSCDVTEYIEAEEDFVIGRFFDTYEAVGVYSLEIFGGEERFMETFVAALRAAYAAAVEAGSGEEPDEAVFRRVFNERMGEHLPPYWNEFELAINGYTIISAAEIEDYVRTQERLDEGGDSEEDEDEDGEEEGEDTDGDGIKDATDNCPDDGNEDQADFDGDGVGDACDNCYAFENPEQRDTEALLCTDTDNDSVADFKDNCTGVFDPTNQSMDCLSLGTATYVRGGKAKGGCSMTASASHGLSLIDYLVLLTGFMCVIARRRYI